MPAVEKQYRRDLETFITYFAIFFFFFFFRIIDISGLISLNVLRNRALLVIDILKHFVCYERIMVKFN